MKSIVSHEEFENAMEDMDSMIGGIVKAQHLESFMLSLKTFWKGLDPAPGEISKDPIYLMLEVEEALTPDQAEQMGKILIMAAEVMRNFKYWGYHVQGDDPDFNPDLYILPGWDPVPVPVSEEDLLKELEAWNQLLADKQKEAGLSRTMIQYGLFPFSAISDHSHVELQIEFLDIDFITTEELKILAPIYFEAFNQKKYFKYKGAPIEGAEGTEKMRRFLSQLHKALTDQTAEQ